MMIINQLGLGLVSSTVCHLFYVTLGDKEYEHPCFKIYIFLKLQYPLSPDNSPLAPSFHVTNGQSFVYFIACWFGELNFLRVLDSKFPK